MARIHSLVSKIVCLLQKLENTGEQKEERKIIICKSAASCEHLASVLTMFVCVCVCVYVCVFVCIGSLVI